MSGRLMSRVGGVLAGMVLLTLGVLGCTADDVGASSASTPVATAACPVMEGIDLPPECAGYDPDAAMAANDRHRERTEIDDATRSGNADTVSAVTTALDEVRTAGTLDEVGVHDALISAGLSDVQLHSEPGRILFGAIGPVGGCVYGQISEDDLSVDVGGFIMDGGCLPAQ
jgi:hypothetical protein